MLRISFLEEEKILSQPDYSKPPNPIIYVAGYNRAYALSIHLCIDRSPDCLPLSSPYRFAAGYPLRGIISVSDVYEIIIIG